ncbi:MAG: helix-turn-helix domain-containing protein [Flavobacteriales bacterium]|nr:helix-turn-helix domain-containing protein [Flavobacteriales bacterium]
MAEIEEILPFGEVSRFVESYWRSDRKQRISLIPDGTLRILFSSKPLFVYDKEVSCLLPGIYLIPIQSRALNIELDKDCTIIRCKAFVLSSIEENSFDTKQDGYWRFNSNEKSIQHYFSLMEENKFEVSEFIEGFVFDILTKQFQMNENLRHAVNYVLDRRGLIKVGEMAQDFGVSRQSLHNLFVNKLQLSPKQLAKIWKINSFIDYVQKGEKLTAAAIDSGYYDQAHCIKEFNQLMGHAPRSFFANNHAFVLSCISNRFSNFYDPR